MGRGSWRGSKEPAELRGEGRGRQGMLLVIAVLRNINYGSPLIRAEGSVGSAVRGGPGPVLPPAGRSSGPAAAPAPQLLSCALLPQAVM